MLKKKGRPKLPSLKNLKKKAWNNFSKWIRLRDTNETGFCKCCTCGTVKHWKEMHAGHFVKSGHSAVKFDEHNVHAQCPSCNTFKGGMQDEYSRFIIETYGIEEFNRLLDSKKIAYFKRTRQDYEDIVEKYKC